MALDTYDQRDNLAAVLGSGGCPLCGLPLTVDKPRYGWGSQGAGAKCSACGLRVRAAWVPLHKAVVKLGLPLPKDR